MVFSSSTRFITRKEVNVGLYRRNGTGNWWRSFTVAGVQYRQSTGTDHKKLAGLILADMEIKILKKERLGIEAELEYFFDEMMDKFMSEYAPRKAESTQLRFSQSLKHLKPFFTRMRLSAIEKEPGIIDQYMRRRLGELTCRGTPTRPATVNRELAIEILKLRRVHVDLENKRITVIKPNSKNKVGRTIPILSETVVRIQRHRLNGKVVGIQPANDYVFATRSGRRISARNLQRALEKACAMAAIDDLVFHDLRHTFGTWLAQNGVDIYTIARYMGHRSLESTKRYLHHNAESLKAAIGTIEKMIEKLQRIAEVDG